MEYDWSDHIKISMSFADIVLFYISLSSIVLSYVLTKAENMHDKNISITGLYSCITIGRYGKIIVNKV